MPGASLSLAWAGNAFFAPALLPEAAGCSWRVAQFDPPPGEILGWEDIVARAGFTPDILVVADKSTPPFVLGVEHFPCLTILYAVDTHIHSWLPLYAQAFDCCLVSLRDHLPLFRNRRLADKDLFWFPPYAAGRPVPRNPDLPVHDLLFVGTVDPRIAPERFHFMRELAALFPGFHYETTTRYPERFAQARLVLNHTADNDLNFRVFQALGAGACLLTPRIGHGQETLFREGEELFLYDQADIPGLAARAEELLRDPARLERVAAQGLAAVDACHRMEHRAARLQELAAERIRSGGSRARQRDPGAAQTILNDYLRVIYLLHAETTADPGGKRRYLEAAKPRNPASCR